ncbi:TonB-dependent receptor [Elizabethkingia argentiflava]|uniref:TonB-dependent receptor n=1 Tax=Elizabethkingia argenteiflava TaxID=2681556 RepID=A0A845PV91_9FLAO|nr:TonB-dependent receptor [Elizabethkingia argenteiflava]NAW51033.1 TonB-dependent receptor [Elizabethkingia argenteiflava]
MLKKLFYLVFIFIYSIIYCQTEITGIVISSNKAPVSGANVYLENTILGDTSNEKGQFRIVVEKAQMPEKKMVLIINAIGFDDKRINLENHGTPTLNIGKIVLEKGSKSIDEVVISANSVSIGKSRGVERMNSLDVVMTGSSNGDIVGALQSLPGTQKVGEDGKLYIRGGDSNELGTYIDGMHVFSPYTASAQDTPSRGRFSPFIFKGINLSLGGYELEYGQALSSILPMETKDVSGDSKLGVNFSPLSVGGGGTLGRKNRSVSFNLNYTNLGVYNQIFPDRYNWKKDYSNFSGEGQFKNTFKDQSQLKVYWGYNRTDFIREYKDINTFQSRDLEFSENNYYLNTTYQTKPKNGLQYFVGLAFSRLDDQYSNTKVIGDHFNEGQQEIHSKFRIKKTFTKYYKITTGFENFMRNYDNQYYMNGNKLQNQKLRYFISALFADNQLRLKKGLYTNISARLEYNDYNNSYVFYPRLSLDYIYEKFQSSLIYGRYYQLPGNIILAKANNLSQEVSDQYIASLSYENSGIALKTEFYYKKYANLWLLKDNQYTSNGYGNSKGFDVYFSDDRSIKNIKYSFSYSYNDSKRLYSNYPELAKPAFASKHNIRLNAQYFILPIKIYLGMTHTFTSGRPYNNPGLSGFNSSKTPVYNSLDVNASILLSKKVILYASLSNVLGRQNIFTYRYADQVNSNGFYNNEPIIAPRKRFFYLGVFISLKNNSAYDVSNF